MSIVPLPEFVAGVRKNLRYNVKTILLGLDIGAHFAGASVSDE